MTVGASSANMAQKLLNIFRGGGNGVTFTAPAAITMQMHTADPGASGTTAASVGDATKRAITHAAASGSNPCTMAISGTAPVYTNGGTTETLTHTSYWDTTTFLQSAALASGKAWASGDTYTHSTDTWSNTPTAA